MTDESDERHDPASMDAMIRDALQAFEREMSEMGLCLSCASMSVGTAMIAQVLASRSGMTSEEYTKAFLEAVSGHIMRAAIMFRDVAVAAQDEGIATDGSRISKADLKIVH